MDAYPEDYVVHNLPFLLLSGLEADTQDDNESSASDYPLLQEKGPTIYSDFPPLSGPTADELRSNLLEEDVSRVPWDAGQPTGARSSGIGYRIKSVGRSYRLPPRKADPPPLSPPTSPTGGQQNDAAPAPSFVLHSPISPLTPSSPTFPDGLLTPLWVSKHQNLVPAAVINFFPFCLDSNMSSLRDNQLKIEINGLKQEWTASGYNTRFIVVLLPEEGAGDYIEEMEERVASIRRATNLDQKSIILLPPDANAAELKELTRGLLSLIQPLVTEYYRDLSKHARRKRNRSTIPPPTAPPTSGTSQTLSLQGWNVRYEFKLGIFAEFRQEIDAALRNYESAYETLFGQDVIENIAGWSPRFNDARLLSDALAIRIIRCLLWTGQTSAAVRSWIDHRTRSQDILNRRGKGTRNYGWEAWEARWSMVMAQLIRQAGIPGISDDRSDKDGAAEQSIIFVHRRKSASANEVTYPWEQLHHEGYWLYRSAKHAMARRTLAEQIPDEDRISPGQSPASQIANKSYMYDTYLAPGPHIEASGAGSTGFNHSQQILNALKGALEQFAKRKQTRKIESLSLEIAEEYMRVNSWAEAYEMLRPLWPSLTWRHSGWWLLMAKFGWALRECALRMQDSEMALRVDWELMHRVFQPRPGWHYSIHRGLAEFPDTQPKASVVLKAEDVISCVTATFVFEKSEGNVGEPLKGQLILTSCAQRSSDPIRLSEVKIVFEGCLRPLKIQADQDVNADAKTPCIISSLTLREPTSADSTSLNSPTIGLTALVGLGDLTLGPSQTKVFNVTSIPREAGESRVASITLLIDEEKFDLACAITELARQEAYWWQETTHGAVRRRVGKGRDTSRCKIMPKPPKIRIKTSGIKSTYYTNERVILQMDVHNEEDEAADVTAEIRLFGQSKLGGQILWLEDEDETESHRSRDSSPIEGAHHFLRRSIGIMERSSRRDLALVLTDTLEPSTYELEINCVYNLVSDIQTPIIATHRVTVSVVRPFEANYEFLPRLHPEPWPDFFTMDEDSLEDDAVAKPRGLHQRWCLNSKVVSFALEPLIIEKISVVLLNLGSGAICNIGPEMVVSADEPEIRPEELRESNFTLDLQKLVLGDRRPTALNLALEIQWRRSMEDTASPADHTSATTTTTLPIPRFIVPTGEPRILASAVASQTLNGVIHLDYTLENPSTHFLTFNLAMEASENFAFSGPKTMVVQLVPLSRHTVRYNLLASKRGLWIQPQLIVVDTYFNKTLRVQPTEEMRSDKKGILVWVDADD
ncbi:uncharacterized protein ACLA_026400 [Aspergillus clavatus NRRL 1]|uniref:Uncharacterized protein n=1 Tax=Aspergillus clavatus (strain ATCC 1007 / CBS 513.65 / DSM 816 / NCTC 3887 / NRRL 1 / QM 1276 / 107) TaxID=344612 RepID=A1CQK2_ASPCL|nr:uncharacterized protein ACLA_026400 [Aspergillus clavatus NRRL 1]EAW07923.1 conserved hypothetical protein [Aspergillus clavatus NRRL 1]